MYGKRGRVVHGAIQLEPDEAVTLRDEALRITVECLRRLYQHRTDLLPINQRVGVRNWYLALTLMVLLPPDSHYRQMPDTCRIVKVMPQQVLPNNQEDREVYLRERDAVNFIEAVGKYADQAGRYAHHDA